MKKIKLVLLSASIFAAGSAFISRPMVDEYVKDNGVWKLKTMASGFCKSQPESNCTFVLKSTATQPYDDDSDFTPDDVNRTWIHTP
jgi:hypothetical protein